MLPKRALRHAVLQRGKEVMASLPKDKKALVILGRPYNTTDPLLNLRLVEKLINLNTLCPFLWIFCRLVDENIFEDYKMMYWPNGQKIMSASRIVRKTRESCTRFTWVISGAAPIRFSLILCVRK
jgi:predicted nucleotide-binding protein (sugar kinase/HSP70/actin superfamily)